mmetsp:Transcript_20518/g.63842  ORF Transcript_20518/g.63842 Transcript_20518/m.63842 type:complete len:241 (-) Transcript_20518:11-733(-)
MRRGRPRRVRGARRRRRGVGRPIGRAHQQRRRLRRQRRLARRRRELRRLAGGVEAHDGGQLRGAVQPIVPRRAAVPETGLQPGRAEHRRRGAARARAHRQRVEPRRVLRRPDGAGVRGVQVGPQRVPQRDGEADRRRGDLRLHRRPGRDGDRHVDVGRVTPDAPGDGSQPPARAPQPAVGDRGHRGVPVLRRAPDDDGEHHRRQRRHLHAVMPMMESGGSANGLLDSEEWRAMMVAVGGF